jgi:hypothetical protein
VFIVLPFFVAGLCYFIRISKIRFMLVLITGCLLIAGALALIFLTPFGFSLEPIFGVRVNVMVEALDFFLLTIILYFGFKHRSWVIKALLFLRSFIASDAFSDQLGWLAHLFSSDCLHEKSRNAFAAGNLETTPVFLRHDAVFRRHERVGTLQ